MSTKFYMGTTPDFQRIVFKSESEPTWASHGHLYLATIGPFRTKRGAVFMAQYGKGNPHCRCVADAERLAKSVLFTTA